MYNRAEIVDDNFTNFVKAGRFPSARSRTTLAESGLGVAQLIELFESQVLSRHLDLRARILKNSNQCFYTIGSSGHEGNAVFGKVFRKSDMAFLHYRSGALVIQRAKQLFGSTPTYDAMLSFSASSEDPIAGGRHKVFGSHPLMIPPQTSTIASHLPKAMGAALSIGRANDLKMQGVMPADAVVICSFGDASANHSTAQGAINTTAWVAFQKMPIPLVLICEDNGIGISVPTPKGWIESDFSQRVGIKYFKVDGLNLPDLFRTTSQVEEFVRRTRRPVFLHMETVRLLGHAGSDVEFSYNSTEEIEAREFNDPLLHSARIILENHLLSADEILRLYEITRSRVEAVGAYAIQRPKLLQPEEIRATVSACANPKTAPPNPRPESKHTAEPQQIAELAQPAKPLHMAKLINQALVDTLLRYPNAVVFGEDVAKKGGVYNVTDGLFAKFGPKRVFNSLLDEQSILGTALGFAHNGFLPIPEIQFLAYVHNAEDQIRGEAATLAFFSKGQFTNPMVLRIAGLPYQKGFGGHFHNDNSLAVFRDIPGVLIAVPSNGLDAVRMFRTCVREAYEKGRVVVFVEPIALYMTKDLHQEGDRGWSFLYPDVHEELPLGEFGVTGDGQDVTIMTYGNGFYFSMQAEKILREKHGVQCKIIDLRWIAPLNQEALAREVAGAKNILIVDECRKTGSLSEALVAMLVEQHGLNSSQPLPRIKVLAAHDCFITLGVAAAAGLPSKDEIIQECLKLCYRKSPQISGKESGEISGKKSDIKSGQK
jgi:2-oxoisovalerate dehydrogenase E1 component